MTAFFTTLLKTAGVMVLDLFWFLLLLAAAYAAVALGRGIFAGFLQRARLHRVNYAGREIPSGAGLMLAAVLPFFLALGALGGLPALPADLSIVFGFGAMGFALAGLVDDCLGEAEDKGFRGHFRALRRERRLTSGALKVLIGGTTALFFSLALAAFYPLDFSRWYQVILNTALVSLSANTVNLFDLRPGRAGKVFFLGLVFTAALAWRIDIYAGPVLLVAVSFIPLFADDLKARVMLGDTGANFLGAVLGMAMVFWLTPQTKILAAAVLAGLQILSERFSFSKTIDRVGLLRRLDRWGRDPKP